jgi:hypothetical protein
LRQRRFRGLRVGQSFDAVHIIKLTTIGGRANNQPPMGR